MSRLRISPTPSNTPSNTPSITPSISQCPPQLVTTIGFYTSNSCGNFPLTSYTSYIRYNSVDNLLDQVSSGFGAQQLYDCISVVYPYVGLIYRFDFIIDPTLQLCNALYGYYYDRIDYEIISFDGIIGGIPIYSMTERYYHNGILVDTITPVTLSVVDQVQDNCNMNLGGLIPQFQVQIPVTPTPSVTQTPSVTPTLTQTNTQTPSQTPSVTPTLTQTSTQTLTPTPSPTFCYEPKAYLVLDAQTGLTSLNSWMLSQGSSFRGLWLGPPSSNQAIFEAQMNAYISYTGFGTTTFYIEDEPIVSTTSLTHLPEQLFSGTNVWNTWFVPTCPFCEGGNWTTWNGATLTAAQYNKPFYYSGTAIPQGYYRWLTTYTFTNQRTNSDLEQTLDNLVCPATPTPSPTNTMTQTPSVTQTMTQTPSPSVTTTNTPSQTMTQTPSPTITVETCAFLTVRTDASLDVPITGVEVNSVPVTYLSGETFTIIPADPPGYFNTTQTGASETVTVTYGSNIAGQRIELVDCDAVVHCCDLNPGGGTCTFTGVNLGCNCNWEIQAYDGTCT